MNIEKYIDEYTRKRVYNYLQCDATTVHNLIAGEGKYALKNQFDYAESNSLGDNIKASVKGYTRDKDMAISIYKNFCGFLKRKGVNVEVVFPPITIGNSFERLMFIAKYLQDPQKKISDLEDELWVSKRTIEEDLTKLRGLDDNPIQICGKVFKIDDAERHMGRVSFPSTAHPLFITPNLTQVLVTLKGLKAMSENPLYTEYAQFIAMDIWEQLSDYAKERIRFVFSKLIPEDLSWYESLIKEEDEDEFFYSEYRCSPKGNIFLDCIKNGKPFFVEYNDDDGAHLYKNCIFIPGSYDDNSMDVNCDNGIVHLQFSKILKSAYTVEEMI